MRVPGDSSSNRKSTGHTNTLMYTEERNIHPKERIGNVVVDIPKYLVKIKQKTELQYIGCLQAFFFLTFLKHMLCFGIFH